MMRRWPTRATEAKSRPGIWDLRETMTSTPERGQAWQGAYGDHVRVHVNAYRASEIFEDDIRENGDQKATKWLDERWVEKNAADEGFCDDW